jgi:hypothetical protein
MAEDEAPGNAAPEGPSEPDAHDGLDATREQPAADPGATQVSQPQDLGATQADGLEGARLDATRAQPPVDAATEAPRWSARAQVRPPGDAELADNEWDEPAQPGRGILMPVIIAVAVLALATLLGLATWLALRNRGTAPLPTPTTTATVTNRPTTRTSAPPTTTEATSEAPAGVPIPDLRGHTFEDASAQLTAAGLRVARRDATSTSVPAGQVIETSPGAGELVAPGSTVTVTVSLGPPTPPPPPPSSSATTSPAAS